MVSFSTLWATTLAKVEAQGVDCEVTLKTLSMGPADAVTGHYGQFYADSTLHLIAVDPSTGFSVLGAGTHGQLKTDAYSDPAVEVKHGDRILDQFTQTWEVETSTPVTVGDVLTHYKLVLALVEPVEVGGAPSDGVAPGDAIGTAVPKPLEIELIPDTEIITPTIARVQCIADTEIIAPEVLSIATAVSVVSDVPRWFIDGAYHIDGTIAPQGWQTVASGATQAFTADADTANGFVMASATPFALDDATYHHGAVATTGQGSYTVPAQTDNTLHQIKASYALGWGSTGTVCTPTGYSRNAPGATRTYTAAGSAAPNHWHIWLDGVTDLGHSPAVVPAQTDGTYHEVTQVSTP